MVLIGLLFFFGVYRSYHIIRQSQDKETLLGIFMYNISIPVLIA